MAPASSTPAGRILVVDDQTHMCWVLSRLLSERGHDVRVAETVAAAQRVVASGFHCHVAVADFRLPDGDGLALLRELATLVPGSRAILMTSYGNADLRRRTVDERLFAFFDKPFNNELMIRAVEAAVHESLSGVDSAVAETRARTSFPGRSDAGITK